MKFMITFMDRKIEPRIVVCDDEVALQAMYLAGEIGGEKIREGIEGRPERIKVDQIHEGD